MNEIEKALEELDQQALKRQMGEDEDYYKFIGATNIQLASVRAVLSNWLQLTKQQKIDALYSLLLGQGYDIKELQDNKASLTAISGAFVGQLQTMLEKATGVPFTEKQVERFGKLNNSISKSVIRTQPNGAEAPEASFDLEKAINQTNLNYRYKQQLINASRVHSVTPEHSNIDRERYGIFRAVKDTDDACKFYNGRVMTEKQFLEIVPVHANCRCTFEAIPQTMQDHYYRKDGHDIGIAARMRETWSFDEPNHT
jgi:hypothetical protein